METELWIKHKLDRIQTQFGRSYVCPDKKHRPGVTTILNETKPLSAKIAINKWRKKVGNDESQKIINRGNRVHEFIENKLIENKLIDKSINNKPECVEDSQEIDNRCELMNEFLPRISNVRLVEGAVWSPWGYAGTVDCVADLDGELTILDWKTASKPKREEWIEDYKMQVAAYCAAVNRVYGTKINRGAVVITSQELQVFKIGSGQMKLYWEKFKDRLDQYQKLK